MILKACTKCGKLSPTPRCPEHTVKPWAKAQRPERTRGRKLQRINQATMLAHDGICHICGKPGSDQIDHVIPLAEGGEDTPDNRRPIHSVPCHREKTAAEAQRGRHGRT